MTLENKMILIQGSKKEKNWALSTSQHTSAVALWTQPGIRPQTRAGSHEQEHEEWGQETKKTTSFMPAMASGIWQNLNVFFFQFCLW